MWISPNWGIDLGLLNLIKIGSVYCQCWKFVKILTDQTRSEPHFWLFFCHFWLVFVYSLVISNWFSFILNDKNRQTGAYFQDCWLCFEFMKDRFWPRFPLKLKGAFCKKWGGQVSYVLVIGLIKMPSSQHVHFITWNELANIWY